ncbi:MAG TPA: hypothetical protein VLH08_16165, partial [Acidobacteriota bacterium]|nr:hypothetical protein [Acidobacteriota bacterium]
KTNGTPTLVFLDKGVGQNFVNWNDPFLKSNVIFARDLKEHNAEVERLFPNHKPVWFRMTSSFEKAKITGGFKFANEPDRSPSGSFNLFDLAMALQAPRNYPKQDFFDICYIDIFDYGSAAQTYQFLEQAELEPLRGGEYKRNFRKGMVHAGKMMLLPIIAFEKYGDQWKKNLDTSRFRAEFKSAQISFESSEEVGKTILTQMDKVNKRIDRNSDQKLSDPEILLFLNEKIKLIRQGASL